MNTIKFIFKYIFSFGVLTNKGKKNLSIQTHDDHMLKAEFLVFFSILRAEVSTFFLFILYDFSSGCAMFMFFKCNLTL